MKIPFQLVLATNNQNKVAELNHLLQGDFRILTLKDIGFNQQIEETGTTLHENARIKSQLIFEKTGLPTLSDDSGLFVDALEGRPGVYSARYAGPQANDQDNIQLLLRSLATTTHRSATFKTVLSFNMDQQHYFFEGMATGVILEQPIGSHGFGYDPVFMPTGASKSFAEMDKETKNQWSHRSKALDKFIEFINNQQLTL